MPAFRRFPSTTLLFFATAWSSAQAQATQDTTKSALPLSPVVVTATRVPVPAVTAGVTVLRGDDLRAGGITHVLDALRQVPGAFLVQSGSFGGQTSLFLRGSQSNYTKVLLDGVPVNDPGGAFDFANLSTENVDRIEVVRGPASVLYGSDAVAGVIQIFTRRGSGAARASVSATGGSFSTAQLDAGVSGSVGGADFAATVGQFQTDGIYAFNNHDRHTTLGGRLGVTPDSLTDVGLTLQYADNKAGIPTDGAGNVVDQNAFQYGQRFAFGLDAGRRLAPNVEARLLLASSTSDGGFNDQQDNLADTLGFYGSQNLDHIQRQSADGRVNITVRPGIVATAGGALEVEQERSFNSSQSQFGPSNGSFDAFRRNGAGYVDVVGTDAGFAWNAGARFDDNQAFGTFGTYRIGAAYEFSWGSRVRAAFGTAFREPTFFENFATGFVNGNPALKPEHTRSWELGLDQRLTGSASLFATWFNQRFEDLIDFTFNTPGPTSPNYFNIAAADANGLEAGARVVLLPEVILSGSYTRLSTSIVAAGYDSSATGLFAPGSKLVRRPDYTWSVQLTTRPIERARLFVRAVGTGDRQDIDFNLPGRVTLPAYAVVDVAADVLVAGTAADRHLTLTVRLANALDEQYQAVKGFPAPGRSLLAGASASW